MVRQRSEIGAAPGEPRPRGAPRRARAPTGRAPPGCAIAAAFAAPAGRALAAAALVALAACATAPAPEAEPAPEAAAPAARFTLREDPRCEAAGPEVARLHAAAAARVRGALALGVEGPAYTIALDALALAQRACFDALPPTQRAAALDSFRWALLQDLDEPRADRGGVPSLPWRLLQDGAVRAAASVSAAETARDGGAVDIAVLRLTDAQRARLAVLPEVLRFVEEERRSEVLLDPVLVGWLGVPP